MPCASFGDLHLGPTEGRERFVQREEPLEALCTHLEATHDRIVLMGDIYQADCGWRLGSDARIVADIQRRFARLTRRWAHPPYRLLPGNHDALTPSVPLRFSAHGLTAIYRHGHMFDPISRGLGSKLTMWSLARLRQYGLKGIADTFEEVFLDRAHRWKVGDEHLGLIGQAERMLQDASIDIVVMGHSHRQACIRLGHGVYANSGICCADALAYTSVDLLQRYVEIDEFIPGRGPITLVRAELPERLDHAMPASPASERAS